MEEFPVDCVDANTYKRVGAALVLPNDIIYAVDCTRNGIHGVARLLMAHQLRYPARLSSLCVKKTTFLVHEYINVDDFQNETVRVDNLFKVSAVVFAHDE